MGLLPTSSLRLCVPEKYPDFSLLRPTNPYLVGIRPHREGGVCLKIEDEPVPSRYGSNFLISQLRARRCRDHLELRMCPCRRGSGPNADTGRASAQDAAI